MGLAGRFAFDTLLEAEMEDDTTLEGITLFLGRDLGRHIGIASARFYHDAEVGVQFLAGSVKEACDTYRVALLGAGGMKVVLDAFVEGVLTEASLIHVEKHSPVLYRLPVRRGQQLTLSGDLQDAVDLLRNAQHAVSLHRRPMDDVAIAYLAQISVFTDVVEDLRLNAATEHALSTLRRSGDAAASIAAARNFARCRLPFNPEQRRRLREAIGSAETQAGAGPARPTLDLASRNAPTARA